SLTIAQSILESSWGKSELAQEANALFGIKASDWNGRMYRKITKEEENGKIKLIEADFRAYDNVEDSIHDHNKFLQKDRYIKVREAKNYKEATKAILDAGYATASNYTNQLNGLIEKYELFKYDSVEEYKKTTKILIMAGHTESGKMGAGAIGYINESDESRKVAKDVVEYLKKLSIDGIFASLDEAKSSNYSYDQVEIANNIGDFDCVVQIHFDSGSMNYDKDISGTKTYYVSDAGKVFSDRVNSNLSTLFNNGGSIKDTTNIYWLKNTINPAILIEICFVDNKDDVEIYNKNFNKVCELIAQGLSNKTLHADVKEFNLNEIVIYDSDEDIFAALELSQNNNCPMIKKIDFEKLNINVNKIYTVGNSTDDKYKIFKDTFNKN
ncbi:MAG: glucosaminidase domain-containing protein, partial [Peptostreptococcaceae bacterium]